MNEWMEVTGEPQGKQAKEKQSHQENRKSCWDKALYWAGSILTAKGNMKH